MSPRDKSPHNPLSAELIQQVARQQMAARGTAGLSLRGIARRLNVTAPAIYNYFSRLDDLITALLVEAFTRLAEAMEAAVAAQAGASPRAHIMALLVTYRAWALEHPVDFQLMYGNPIPGYQAPAEITTPLARRPFLILFQIFADAYVAGQLHIPREYAAVPDSIQEHLGTWKQSAGIHLPDPLLCLLFTGWGRVHGLVMLELFNHLQPLVGDPGALYIYELEAYLQRSGL